LVANYSSYLLCENVSTTRDISPSGGSLSTIPYPVLKQRKREGEARFITKICELDEVSVGGSFSLLRSGARALASSCWGCITLAGTSCLAAGQHD
jgi:hypothetical protein